MEILEYRFRNWRLLLLNLTNFLPITSY